MTKTISQVRHFWENNPLWTGESKHLSGTKEFFEEHLRIVTEDGYAGMLDERMFPTAANKGKVLDLGCGPGLWIVELARRGCEDITAVDLTQNGLSLAQKRCQIYNVLVKFSQQNAECLAFNEATFSHVNCQGVIHHTPDTEACLKEIARVLEKSGTASISVYHRNIFLRSWYYLRWLGKLLTKLGAGLSGRGREAIFTINDVDEIVRLYDGKDNPIGKSYTRKEFIEMLNQHFHVKEIFYHYFPARAIPLKLPSTIHKWLDRYTGFMVYATVQKR